MTPRSWDEDELRTRFTSALSEMYRAEVPLYGKLVEIVHEVDRSTLAAQLQNVDALPLRHRLERHGAIRLGTKHEMHMIKRLFAIMGMHPVGYYNLEMVGFPLHGTAFRPVREEALRRNPFRVFTTVLRTDLITSSSVRQAATDILNTRRLFSPRLCKLMDQAERQNILTPENVEEFIREALEIFRWHSLSTVSMNTYLTLKSEHPMVADIVCFPSAHINHLTPRTLDIDAVQETMIQQGLPAKECIEGPPKRKCPILLRQTSFKALEERVGFRDREGTVVIGTHTARFGEVEQRGAAVTRKGRDLYDRLLASAVRKGGSSNLASGEPLAEAFREFPDDWTELRERGLVFFRYSLAKSVENSKAVINSLATPVSMDDLLKLQVVQCEPITYEDFLPFSAAGIFRSNLGDGATDRELQATASSCEELERVLDCTIPNEIDLYDELQRTSIRKCCEALGLAGLS